MTPDDMEGRLAEALKDVERTGMTHEDVRIAGPLFDAVNRSRALLLAYQERGRALANLIRMNEEHNAAVEKVMGRPLNWSDEYLNEARATLKGKSHD